MNECDCWFCVTVVNVCATSLNIQDISSLLTRGIFSFVFVPTVIEKHIGFNRLNLFVMETSWRETLKLQVIFKRRLKDFKKLRNTLDSIAYNIQPTL